MPGSLSSIPAGAECDEPGCDQTATRRVQGETDSMGCEYIDLCESHFQAHIAAARNFKNPGRCDWCKSDVEERRSRRDYEEGMSGRIYEVCLPCINLMLRRQQEEYDD